MENIEILLQNKSEEVIAAFVTEIMKRVNQYDELREAETTDEFLIHSAGIFIETYIPQYVMMAMEQEGYIGATDALITTFIDFVLNEHYGGPEAKERFEEHLNEARQYLDERRYDSQFDEILNLDSDSSVFSDSEDDSLGGEEEEPNQFTDSASIVTDPMINISRIF